MWEQMQPTYLPEPTIQTWALVASRFDEKLQFPHCVGAMAGKRVVIKKPGKNGSSHNYIFATVDADYKFTTVDVSGMEKLDDGSLLSCSVLGKQIMNQTLALPAPEQLTTIAEQVPYVFVGDEAFPLSENLMKPYESLSGKYKRQIFNARFSRAHQTVECAFGQLASRFRVFRNPFDSKVGTVRDVVKATCVLHNYLKSSADTPNENVDDIELLPQNQLLPLQASNVPNSQRALRVRKLFTEYFNKFGAVEMN